MGGLGGSEGAGGRAKIKIQKHQGGGRGPHKSECAHVWPWLVGGMVRMGERAGKDKNSKILWGGGGAEERVHFAVGGGGGASSR